MGTITLELVREGPPHNQLLSPITPYIALAGNRPAETVRVPIEHGQMLARLRRLRYDAGRSATLTDLREASQVVTLLLESVRGLAEAIAEHRAASTSDEGAYHHLRIVLSANELAMLPFELAQGPLVNGGSDMLSVLRPPPVVITRETRRVPAWHFDWPDDPRVLFIAADPSRGGLPLDASLLALRNALDPWLRRSGGAENDDEAAHDEVRERIHVLLDASLDDVRRACATGRYTHVHVLAHGSMPATFEARPTVRLHRVTGDNEVDEVTGERLAAALCAPRTDAAGRARPMVVTLAVCDAGNQGSILYAGGSVAHTVHEAGVPLVVASQFPLTFRGAVLMTEEIYTRLFHREDPREVIAAARHRLYADLGETHDWAAVVAYTSLPENLDVVGARYKALRLRLDRVMEAVDPPDSRPPRAEKVARWGAELDSALDAFALHTAGLAGERRKGALGKLASAYKRRARLRHVGDVPLAVFLGAASGDEKSGVLSDLQRSLDCYRAYIREGTAEAWPYVQIVALLDVLGGAPNKEGKVRDERAHEEAAEWWPIAEFFANDTLRSPPDTDAHFDALVSLIELRLLALRRGVQLEDAHKIAGEALDYSNRALALFTRHRSPDIERNAYYSLRQFNRYLNWWWGRYQPESKADLPEPERDLPGVETLKELVKAWQHAGVRTTYLRDDMT